MCHGEKSSAWGSERVRDSRALTVTPAGRGGLMEAFALSV